MLIIRDKALGAPYTQNWQARAQLSQPYIGRGDTSVMAARGGG
jgi:hypothetical protein